MRPNRKKPAPELPWRVIEIVATKPVRPRHQILSINQEIRTKYRVPPPIESLPPIQYVSRRREISEEEANKQSSAPNKLENAKPFVRAIGSATRNAIPVRSASRRSAEKNRDSSAIQSQSIMNVAGVFFFFLEIECEDEDADESAAYDRPQSDPAALVYGRVLLFFFCFFSLLVCVRVLIESSFELPRRPFRDATPTGDKLRWNQTECDQKKRGKKTQRKQKRIRRKQTKSAKQSRPNREIKAPRRTARRRRTPNGVNYWPRGAAFGGRERRRRRALGFSHANYFLPPIVLAH